MGPGLCFTPADINLRMHSERETQGERERERGDEDVLPGYVCVYTKYQGFLE
jgi:hypothetical protein